MFRKVKNVFKKKPSQRRSSSNPVDHRAGSGVDRIIAGSDEAGAAIPQLLAHGHEAVTCVTVAEGGFCLSGAKDSSLALSNFMCGKLEEKWTGHEKEVTKVAYAHSTQLYVSASRDKSVGIWRPGSHVPVHRCNGHELAVTGVAVDPASAYMCSGSRDNSVCLWDMGTGQCVKRTVLAQNLITHVHWGNVANTVAQSGEDKMVHLWDTRTLQVSTSTAPKQYIQTCCDLSACGRYCLSSSNGFAGNGCEATLWDMRSLRLPLREFFGHIETVWGCCFVRNVSSNTQLVATCSSDGMVRLWDSDSGFTRADIAVPASGQLTGIATDTSGHLLVSSFKAGLVLLSMCKDAQSLQIAAYL